MSTRYSSTCGGVGVLISDFDPNCSEDENFNRESQLYTCRDPPPLAPATGIMMVGTPSSPHPSVNEVVEAARRQSDPSCETTLGKALAEGNLNTRQSVQDLLELLAQRPDVDKYEDPDDRKYELRCKRKRAEREAEERTIRRKHHPHHHHARSSSSSDHSEESDGDGAEEEGDEMKRRLEDLEKAFGPAQCLDASTSDCDAALSFAYHHHPTQSEALSSSCCTSIGVGGQQQQQQQAPEWHLAGTPHNFTPPPPSSSSSSFWATPTSESSISSAGTSHPRCYLNASDPLGYHHHHNRHLGRTNRRLASLDAACDGTEEDMAKVTYSASSLPVHYHHPSSHHQRRASLPTLPHVSSPVSSRRRSSISYSSMRPSSSHDVSDQLHHHHHSQLQPQVYYKIEQQVMDKIARYKQQLRRMSMDYDLLTTSSSSHVSYMNGNYNTGGGASAHESFVGPELDSAPVHNPFTPGSLPEANSAFSLEPPSCVAAPTSSSVSLPFYEFSPPLPSSSLSSSTWSPCFHPVESSPESLGFAPHSHDWEGPLHNLQWSFAYFDPSFLSFSLSPVLFNLFLAYSSFFSREIVSIRDVCINKNLRIWTKPQM